MGKITKKVEEQDLTALKEGTTLQSENAATLTMQIAHTIQSMMKPLMKE
jgi:hypothetical protein